MPDSAAESLKEISGGKLDIGLAADGGNDGDAVSARRADFRCILLRDAPDRNAGMLSMSDNLMKPGDADSRSCVRFGPGGKDRPDAVVVNEFGGRAVKLLEITGRKPEDFFGTDEASGIFGREIILPHVKSFGSGSQHDVRMVVNDERDALGRKKLPQRARGFRHAAFFPLGRAKLNYRDAARNRSAGGFHQAARTFALVRVENKVEAQIKARHQSDSPRKSCG